MPYAPVWPWHYLAEDPASRSDLSQRMTVCVAVQQFFFSERATGVQAFLCIAQ
jgi:hypothetical protein